jgi:hypothetical protein
MLHIAVHVLAQSAAQGSTCQSVTKTHRGKGGAGQHLAQAAAVRVFVALHQRCNRQETKGKTVK